MGQILCIFLPIKFPCIWISTNRGPEQEALGWKLSTQSNGSNILISLFLRLLLYFSCCHSHPLQKVESYFRASAWNFSWKMADEANRTVNLLSNSVLLGSSIYYGSDYLPFVSFNRLLLRFRVEWLRLPGNWSRLVFTCIYLCRLFSFMSVELRNISTFICEIYLKLKKKGEIN